MAKLNRAGRKHKRSEGTKTVQPGNYLIVTEGTETEVNYFNNIKQILENLFNNNIIVERVTLKVEGTARSTTVLVNEAIKLAEKEGMNVAWSNESFELWLLLHFQNLNAAIHRDDYIDKLNTHFKNKNLNNGKYDKNIRDIFDITFPYINVAIKRSNSLIEDHKNNNVFSPNKMNPATRVQDLVSELIKYIK
ncbi:RloB family protein [Clostridium sp. ZS1]|uniref:RloB family protein n=1 Tax=Clostridium sp. ZS1 TaxID=2949989 RepID=UPI00207A9DB2|nr:RloB family protein [Clostridium sp. ZS1]